MNNLKYPLDIQLFGGEDDPEPETDENKEVTHSDHAGIDYEKLADTIAKRTSATEVSALKGILKDQGLTGDELSEAVKTYKLNKEAKAKEEQERINGIIKENNEYKKKDLAKIMNDEARTIAKEFNVRDDRFDKLMKLCDKSKFMDEKGIVNKEAIKEEMEAQIKELPEFVSTKKITITKGRGNETPPVATDEEEYRKRKYGKSKYYRG